MRYEQVYCTSHLYSGLPLIFDPNSGNCWELEAVNKLENQSL